MSMPVIGIDLMRRTSATLALLLLITSVALAQTSALEGLSFIKKLKLARAGDEEAQLSVAGDYELGANEARKDPIEAARWYRQAALAGNVEAQFRLAKLITKGAPGLQVDKEAGVKLLQSAAGKGHAPSQNELGLRFQNGDGLAADPAQAAEWFKKAADQKLPAAEVNLGLLYVKGLGVTKDHAAAYKLFNDAAATGDSWALNNLGSMYEMGWGTPKDLAKAKDLYREAAAKGNQMATANLARIDSKATQ